MTDQDARMGLVKAVQAVDAITATINRIQDRFGIDSPSPWWESKDHPDYELVFGTLIAPFRGVVKVADVESDPLSFDQALRELKVCMECSASQARVVDGKVIGLADCPLGDTVYLETGRSYADGRPETVPVKLGSRSWHSDIRAFGSSWEWVMRQCTDPARRKAAIEARLNAMPRVAGALVWRRSRPRFSGHVIPAVEVDVATPFDPPAAATPSNQPNGAETRP